MRATRKFDVVCWGVIVVYNLFITFFLQTHRCSLRVYTPAHADKTLTVVVVADPSTASGYRGVRIARWDYTGKTVVAGDAADRKLLSLVKALKQESRRLGRFS